MTLVVIEVDNRETMTSSQIADTILPSVCYVSLDFSINLPVQDILDL